MGNSMYHYWKSQPEVLRQILEQDLVHVAAQQWSAQPWGFAHEARQTRGLDGLEVVHEAGARRSADRALAAIQEMSQSDAR